MSKKPKMNDDTVVLGGYIGHEDIPDNVTHVQFRPSVEDIDKNAFYCRKSLREVILNDGLRQIRESAFSGCSSLQSINIPSTVTKIGESAFFNCKGLKEVVLNEGLREIGRSAFHNCKLQRILIPSTVTEISYSAFRGCANLRDVVLNNGLKEIGSNAFDRCSSLQSISLPWTVNDVGQNAFAYCSSLREVVLNDGIKRIKSHTFHNCLSLQSIVISPTVVEIEKYAFNNCSRLSEVVIYNERIQIGDTVFTNCTLLERFKFPRFSARLDYIIQAGQRGIEAKMDDIPAVEWRDGELSIPVNIRAGYRNTDIYLDKEKLVKVEELLTYYEMKEATTLFELALWKASIDQAEAASTDREAYQIEVPGPVKDTILQYLLGTAAPTGNRLLLPS